MTCNDILAELIGFADYLYKEERSENTIQKYLRDVRAFGAFLAEQSLDKALVIAWKEQLTTAYAPASVNSMLAAVNCFLEWVGLGQCRVKPLKLQRTLFVAPERELTRSDYNKLVKAAEEQRKPRLALLLQTICATGIRVSELRYITCEAVQQRRALVDCKGKSRVVFLPRALCHLLLDYCRGQGRRSGAVFCTRSGVPLDRTNIWREMKTLCQAAGVSPCKVFPHNLRHLFAKVYYQLEKDIARLADVLGHASVNTTRIYMMESGEQHIRQIERMGLIVQRK